MKKYFVVGLILIAVLVTGCSQKESGDTINSDKVTEETVQFEPIGCYRFKDAQTGLYGYMDGKGNVIIEPKYRLATDFQYVINDYAQAFDASGTITIIDKKGKEYLPFGEYKFVALPIKELIIFQEYSGKCGVVNLEGKRILEPIYDNIEINGDGFIIVISDKKYGVFNKYGDIVLDVNYDYIFGAANCLIAQKDGKYGLFNSNGEEIIPAEYKEVQIYHTVGIYDTEIFKALNYDDKSAFFDNTGKQLTEFVYDDSKAGRDGLIPVAKGDKWGYIDIKGNETLPFNFDFASSFSDGEAEIEINGERKFINTKGEFVESRNNSYKADGKKYTIVKDAGIYKVVNGKNEVIIDNNYTSLSIYNNNLLAKTEGSNYLLDLKGNILLEGKAIIPIGKDLFVNSEDDWAIKGQIVNSKGKVISDEIYDDVTAYEMFNKIVAKKLDGNYVVLDIDGNEILDIEPGASEVSFFEEDLIRVYFDEENFKWINSKGEILP